MTKERILLVFKDINQMYNNARMYDGLSQMLDELVEDSKKSVEPESEPKKKASWLWDKFDKSYHCSRCWYDPIHEDLGELKEYKFCARCGAEMEVDG